MTGVPTVMAMLVLAGAVYGRGAIRLGRRARRTAAFYAGLAVLAVALIPPLDTAAAERLSAHMVQHLLLMLLAAPLLAYARPAAAFVAGLPTEGRAVIRRARSAGLRSVGEIAAHPLAVWTVGVVVLWAWHMPSLYELALSHDALHAAEHLTFLGAAVLFWAVVLSSGARRGVGRPVAILLVLATGAQGAALGAFIVFASTPLYTVHTGGLDDQQLAGALMWGPPGLLYVTTMAWLLVRWFAEMEDASTDEPVVVAGRPR